jgi:Neuraminidase (sialidase)
MSDSIEICDLCKPTIMEGETPNENHCTTLSIIKREALNTNARYEKDGIELLKMKKPGDFANIRSFSEILKDLDRKIGLAEGKSGMVDDKVAVDKGRSFFCTLDIFLYKKVREGLEQKIEQFREIEEYVYKKKMEYIMQPKKTLNSRKL